MTWKLGIDIGGTNFALGAVNKEGKIIDYLEHPVGEYRDLSDASALIAKLAEKFNAKLGSAPESIGAGVPGIIDYKNQIAISMPHFPEWANSKVGEYLSKTLNQAVKIDNDANLAGLAELVFGVGKKLNSFIFMTLGTGIGGGIVIDRKVFRGDTGFAGEIGHIVINAMDNRDCPCGGKGCFEMFASGKSVPYIFEFLSSSDQGEISKSLGDKPVNAKNLYELAVKGVEGAKNLWIEYGYWLGIGMASLSNTLGIKDFVLGGNVSGAFEFFKDSATDNSKHFSHVLRSSGVNLYKSEMGPLAGIIGASQLI